MGRGVWAAVAKSVKIGAALSALTIGCVLLAGGTMLVVRGATDPYDSPAWIFYFFGAIWMSAGLLFLAPPLIWLARRREVRPYRAGGKA